MGPAGVQYTGSGSVVACMYVCVLVCIGTPATEQQACVSECDCSYSTAVGGDKWSHIVLNLRGAAFAKKKTLYLT